MYEEERKRILGAIGAWLVDIQHIGSTAVPGLAAKPIIDIMPGIRGLAGIVEVIQPMQSLGYQYFPEYEVQLPERRYFRRPAGETFRGRGTHHVHIVEPASAFWRRHLAFRDYLRLHPGAAEEYATLKRRLAAQYRTDPVGYTDAKTEFITRVEALALARQNGGGQG